MKSYIIRFVLILVSWYISMHFLTAQEGGFHYQAALRTADGSIISDQTVKIRITIQEGGNSFFSEDHVARTNQFGILNLIIGAGVGQGSLAEIPWGSPGLKMQIELDEGSGFRLLGSTSLMPVPYALFAKEAENARINIEDITLNEAGELTIVLADQQIFNVGNVRGPQGETGDVGPIGPEGPQGPQGAAGRDGSGIKIIGSISTVGDLDLAHDGAEGDMVITIDGGVGFVWDGSEWIEVGPIRGPEGPVGPAGAQGIEGPQGVPGPQGTQGISGPQGEQGEPGPAGEQGLRGPQGPAGQDGTGVQIIGSVANESDLDPNHPGDQGDMVIIEETGEGFVWNGSVWIKVGKIQGPQGPAGQQGIQGLTGLQGARGVPGPQGPQGLQGEQGPQGIQGPAGPAGVDGAQGARGPAGDIGPAGPQGPQGIQGPQGPRGERGDVGPEGPKGDQGDIGPQGPQGDIGPTGLPGADGQDGIDGQDGAPGVPGPKGDQGDVGSAGRGIADVRDQDNELVIDFDDGTSKNVGNFKGPKGDPGADGQDGIDGQDGAPGIPGPKGDQGDVGPAGRGIVNVRDQDNDLVFDFDDGTSQNVGNFKGPKGDPGADGQDGATGAQGPKGDQGDPGPQGIQGEKGDSGTDGQNGVDGKDGATGAQGPKGDQGDPGPQGIKGEKGDPGTDGQNGVDGQDGAQGIQGPKGDQGDIGPEGPKGDRGSKGDAGLPCWDLDGDGIKDSNEDTNGDGKFDALDCQGPQGAKGDPGAPGSGVIAFGIVESCSEAFDGNKNVTVVPPIEGPLTIAVSGASLKKYNYSFSLTPMGSGDLNLRASVASNGVLEVIGACNFSFVIIKS